MKFDDLQAVSWEDDLTGLYNRRFLQNYLATQVDWAGAAPVSFIHLDIDAFHRANDKYGREEGDHALKVFGERLKGFFRDKDTVARDGGDAFFVILPEAAKDEAAAVAAKIVENFRNDPVKTRKDQFPIELTVSAGVVSFPEDGRDPDSIRKAADRVLFHAKKTGHNKVSVGGRIDEQVAAERDLFSGIPCPVFLGRKAETAAAAGLVDDLKAGKATALLVQGAAGIGKSRFLKEIAREATARQTLFLHVICTEAHKQSTGHALLFLVDQHARLFPGTQEELRASLFPAQRAVARELIGALGGWPAEQVSIPPRDRKPLLLSLLESALLWMARRSPVMFLLDNAGSCDAGTLDILRRALKGGRAPIALVFAIKEDSRGKESRMGADLHAFVQDLQKAGLIQSLSLPPLTRDESAAMVRAVLGDADLPRGFDEMLLGKSQGNPLYIEEAVRSLILRKRITRDGSRYVVPAIEPRELPDTLQGLIEQELANLPPEAGELITNASILGSRFDMQELQEVMGKREGETLDVVDQVQNAKLIEHLERGGADDFAFRSSSAREIRFVTTAEDARKRMEARRSSVLRARSTRLPPRMTPGPASLQPPVAAPAPVERPQPAPGGTAEAAIGRVPRIPESARPLSAPGWKAAGDFVRALNALLRIGRLYPQWSQTSAQFAVQMQEAAKAMLAESKAVTFSGENRDSLAINGREAGPGQGGEALADFQSLLASKLVASMTLAEGVEPRELEALVAALSAPLDRARAAGDHWDRFLDREGIKRIDLRQRRYVAREADSETRFLRHKEFASRPLTPEEIDELRSALRGLKAAADNLHLYPPGHALVEESLEESVRALTVLAAKLRIVDLAPSADGLLVNGFPTDSRAVGDGGAWLADQLTRRKLGSMTVTLGLRSDEVQAVVSAFSIPAEENSWREVLQKSGGDGAHVRFGSVSYTKVGEHAQGVIPDGVLARASGGAPAPAGAEPPPAAAPEAADSPIEDTSTLDDLAPTGAVVRADIRARVWLKAPEERFLSEEFEHEFGALLEAISVGWMESLGTQLVARLTKLAAAPLPEQRTAALRILAKGLAGTQLLRARGPLVARVQEVIGTIVAVELDPAALRQITKTLEAWMAAALPLARFHAISDLLHKVRKRIEARTVPVEFIESVQAALKAVSDGPESPMVKAIKDPTLREPALKAGGLFGPALIPTLVEMIAESDDAIHRRLAAGALNEIGGHASAELAKEVTPQASAKRAANVLTVLERVQPRMLDAALATGLRHDHRAVGEAAAELLKRLDKPIRAVALRTLLATPAAADALKVAAEIGAEEIGAEAAKLLQGTEEERVARAGCGYFLKVRSPLAAPALRRVFEARPKLFGLIKGFSDETRAMAVRACALLGHEDAKKVVDEARQDKNEVIRAAVKG